MSDHTVNSGRKTGRPRKGDPPRVPYEELDRILVFGEVVETEDGAGSTVVYPSYRDLARRFGVSNSLIATYSKQHNCLRRREAAQVRTAARTDQKLVELRANAFAYAKDEVLRLIDGYLAGFEKALANDSVRFDNPADFNTVVRLKAFVEGGADSRQEVHASLSLADLQERHRRTLRLRQESTPEERGEVGAPAIAALPGPHPQDADPPPRLTSSADAREVSGHNLSGGMTGHFPVTPHVPLCGTPGATGDDEAEERAPAPCGADSAPCGPDPGLGNGPDPAPGGGGNP